MAFTAVKLPKWGVMTEGTIVEWHVDVGATVEAGDPLFSVETDKTTSEVESPRDGIVAAIVGPLNETVPIGTLLMVLTDAPVPPAEVEAFIASRRR